MRIDWIVLPMKWRKRKLKSVSSSEEKKDIVKIGTSLPYPKLKNLHGVFKHSNFLEISLTVFPRYAY